MIGFVVLKPIEWKQSIRHFHNIDAGDRFLTCQTQPDDDVQLSDGSKLSDFSPINFSIVEGALNVDELQKSGLQAPAIGGIWSSEGIVHGWIYLKSNCFDAVWDQVSQGGYVDCKISLGVKTIRSGAAQREFVWNVDYPLSIEDADLQFTRKPIRIKPPDNPPPRRGLFG
jgi:hypothetical protein